MPSQHRFAVGQDPPYTTPAFIPLGGVGWALAHHAIATRFAVGQGLPHATPAVIPPGGVSLLRTHTPTLSRKRKMESECLASPVFRNGAL